MSKDGRLELREGRRGGELSYKVSTHLLDIGYLREGPPK